jgi:hypothetical protein
MCLVHNVIWVHDPDDMMDYCQVKNNNDNRYAGPEHHTGTLTEGPPSNEACTCAHNHCDAITHQMWADYNRVWQERGESVIVDAIIVTTSWSSRPSFCTWKITLCLCRGMRSMECEILCTVCSSKVVVAWSKDVVRPLERPCISEPTCWIASDMLICTDLMDQPDADRLTMHLWWQDGIHTLMRSTQTDSDSGMMLVSSSWLHEIPEKFVTQLTTE